MKPSIGIFSLFFTFIRKDSSLKSEEMIRIKDFLLDFKEAVAKKDTVQLESIIHPLVAHGMDIRSKIISSALKGDEESLGDFSYSDKAFDIILDSLIEKFTPLIEEVRQVLENNEGFNREFASYRNDEIAILDHKGLHIILLLNTPKVKLLFWEGMNKLLT